MRKKKIIFFSRDLRIGGMEKALVCLLNSLVSLELYDVTLILEKKEGSLLEKLNSKVKVEEYTLSKSTNVFVRKLCNFLKRFLWGIKNGNKYCFSCNYATYSTIGSRLAMVSSGNSSLYVHSDYYEYFGGNAEKIRSFFVQQGIQQFKHIIFVSKEAKEKVSGILSEWADKFEVISNLIDEDCVQKAEENGGGYEKDSTKQTIVFLGRLEEVSKKLSRLLEAFKIVSQASDEFRLILVGDGADRKLCEKLISEYSLEKTVKMIGEVINPYPYIKMADCLIMTSDYEGFPVVYNECLVLKTPIMTTVPVSDEYLDFRDYSIITKKDSEDIARALLRKEYRNIKFDKIDAMKINTHRLNELVDIVNRA